MKTIKILKLNESWDIAPVIEDMYEALENLYESLGLILNTT